MSESRLRWAGVSNAKDDLHALLLGRRIVRTWTEAKMFARTSPRSRR
jgi:hypothetical protein